jgi:limonene-1,2-epoxide hydrolase
MGGEAGRIAEAFWEALARSDWEAAAAMLHDDYVEEWPQSGERIVGRDDALAINRNFPGGLPSMQVRRLVSDGDLAVLEVSLTYADGSVWQGVSIMELRDGAIWKQTDYFAQSFEAPQWRAQWVTRMDRT